MHNVTLVGVLAADSMLNVGDYLATEQTFSMISQVSGRAGRGEKKGRVIIQTYNPEHFVVECAKEHDYDNFYNKELHLREQMEYPPFKDIVVISLLSKNEENAKKDAYKTYDELKYKFKDRENIDIFEAIPAKISKINKEYIWRIIIKVVNAESINSELNELLYNNLNNRSNSSIYIEVNPDNLN